MTMVIETHDGVEVITLSPEEWREMIDTNARKYLGMDGDTFLRLYREGKLEDTVAMSEVASLARFGGLVD